jgi:1,4-alpha-glucan branching enzyme
MVRTDPGDEEGWVEITFSLPAACGAEQVHLVGDFNDWSNDATPLERTDDGFEVRVPLRTGRSYRFRYLLDGVRWENDWEADDYEPNDFGGDDSVLHLHPLAQQPEVDA